MRSLMSVMIEALDREPARSQQAIAVPALAFAPTRRPVPGSDAVADGHGGIDERKQK